MDSFVAIDFETANSNHLSACSLGISIVEKGVILETLQTLIKPPDEYSTFDPFNVMIHGIQSQQVEDAPDFKTVWNALGSFQSKYNVPFACHYSGFDIRVIEALLSYYQIEFKEISFYDTLTISKKLWPKLSNHKLNHLADQFNIKLIHHNAASDAEACALIAVKQMEELGKDSLSGVAQHYGFKLGLLNSNGVKTMSDFKHYGTAFRESKADSSKGVTPNREVKTGSDLFGKKIVFTGELTSLTREVAIQRAVNNGAIVNSSVSKKTDFLVVGISDFIDFSLGKATNKLKTAQALSEGGSGISIIDEEDFLKMTIE